MSDIELRAHPFDPESTLSAMRRGNPKIGAVVSFVGLMRDINDGDDVSELFLEHYPGMTEKAIEAIAEEARARWSLLDVLVIHRFGPMAPGFPASSPHG